MNSSKYSFEKKNTLPRLFFYCDNLSHLPRNTPAFYSPQTNCCFLLLFKIQKSTSFMITFILKITDHYEKFNKYQKVWSKKSKISQ